MPRRPRSSIARRRPGAAPSAAGGLAARRRVAYSGARVGVCVAVVTSVGAGGATDAVAQVGESGDALPGIVRVPVHEPEASDRPVTIAGTVAYGFTESVLESGEDVHHRVEGGLALGWRPTSWLGASLRVDGRYDRHLGPTPDEDDDGFVGLPRLALRLGTQVTPTVSLGTQVTVAFPGADAPSIVGEAISADLEAFGAWRATDAATLAFRAGWRFDQGPASIDDPQDLSPADRLGLGLSDADALLLGLGLSGRLSPGLELLAEWTWDLLVGEAAPAASEAPMRLGGGIRWRPLAADAQDRLEVQALVEGTLSRRPDLSDPSGPLVPVEPRVRVMLGLTARLGGASSVRGVTEVTDDGGADADAGADDVATGGVRGSVRDGETDVPIPGAQIVLVPAADDGRSEASADATPGTGDDPDRRSPPPAATVPLVTDAEGGFAIDDLRAGRWTVRVAADGFEPWERNVDIPRAADAPPLIAVLAPDRPLTGELRGVVRSYSGRSIRATIRVEAGGAEDDADQEEDADAEPLEAQADRYGAFSLTLPVGEHIIVIEASRYRTQRRRVQVEEGGVVILNADLRRGRSRRSRGGRTR